MKSKPILLLATSLLLCTCMTPLASAGDTAEDQVAKYKEAQKIADEHLVKFDTLDFDVYDNQKWDRLKESHAEDILVYYPDGSTTKGIPAHIEALKPLFAFAPDTKITAHPIKIAKADWTCVVGEISGTFTAPMKMPDGKVVQPTGKKYSLKMCTVGHWNANGVMSEEYLFWDNLLLMQQIGVIPKS